MLKTARHLICVTFANQEVTMKNQLDQKQMLGFRIIDSGISRIAAKIAGKPRSAEDRMAGNPDFEANQKSSRLHAKIGNKPKA